MGVESLRISEGKKPEVSDLEIAEIAGLSGPGPASGFRAAVLSAFGLPPPPVVTLGFDVFRPLGMVRGGSQRPSLVACAPCAPCSPRLPAWPQLLP